MGDGVQAREPLLGTCASRRRDGTPPTLLTMTRSCAVFPASSCLTIAPRLMQSAARPRWRRERDASRPLEPSEERPQPLGAGFCASCQALFVPAVATCPLCGENMWGVRFNDVPDAPPELHGARADAPVEITLPDPRQYAVLIADLIVHAARAR